MPQSRWVIQNSNFGNRFLALGENGEAEARVVQPTPRQPAIRLAPRWQIWWDGLQPLVRGTRPRRYTFFNPEVIFRYSPNVIEFLPTLK